MTKITFYCYLFLKPYDTIGRYDILWKTGDRFLVKYSPLDKDHMNRSQYITAKIFRSLADAISYIIVELRNLEIKSGVYEHLRTSKTLGEIYHPLVNQLELAIQNNVASFSIFGDTAKYEPLTPATNFLKSMGYFFVSTRAPHVYVLKDFIEREQDSLQPYGRSEHL
jgi:hypothetical protein